jgi:hypothetical protein
MHGHITGKQVPGNRRRRASASRSASCCAFSAARSRNTTAWATVNGRWSESGIPYFRLVALRKRRKGRRRDGKEVSSQTMSSLSPFQKRIPRLAEKHESEENKGEDKRALCDEAQA